MVMKKKPYENLIEEFNWEIPDYYNIGFDVCDKWALRTPKNPAIYELLSNNKVKITSFGELASLSNMVANRLSDFGVREGDRIGILLPQSLACAVSHIALYKMGAIVVPLFQLFGPDALSYRICDSGIKSLITDMEGAKKLEE